VTSRRELQRQLADAKARITTVIEQRNQANGRAGTAEFNQKRLAQRVEELRTELAQQPSSVPVPADESSETWLRERADLLRRISELTRVKTLAELRCVGLIDRCTALQDANDAMCRDRVNHAGNLTSKGVTT
jgi:chromosome segregation ATPase